MTGMEIPGVGMAPGGKIVKPEDEVHILLYFHHKHSHFQLLSACR